MPIGFRIGADRPRVSKSIIERYRVIPVANISDSMFRMAGGGARLRPIGNPAIIGPALAVKTAPGDNLMAHKAIEMAAPGDIIVVDAGGDLTNSIIGERMVIAAHSRGVGGMVINGAIRDLATLRTHPLPIYAAGVTHRGPYKNGPGEINYPIAIDGMVIESGDLIVGDEDGLLCIPIRDAEALLVLSEDKARREQNTPPAVHDGAKMDANLKRLGCEFPAG